MCEYLMYEKLSHHSESEQFLQLHLLGKNIKWNTKWMNMTQYTENSFVMLQEQPDKYKYVIQRPNIPIITVLTVQQFVNTVI